MLSMLKEFKGKWRLCDCPHKCCQCRRSLRVSGDCVTVPTNVANIMESQGPERFCDGPHRHC